MPDLKDELQQLADDAARQARPLPVTEVIRRAGQRHRRTFTRRPRPGPPALRTARPGWQRALVPLCAAAAVAAVAVGAALIWPGSSAPVPSAAARQPGVRPGQWVYRETLSDGSGGRHARLVTVERWATADDSKEAFYFHGKLVVGRFPPAAGTVPYRSLSSLPTDPRALVARLAQLSCSQRLSGVSTSIHGAGSGAQGANRAKVASPPVSARPFPCWRYQDVFTGIGAMLENYVMPPKITADLYRALADIPGVRIEKNAVDVAGRHGTGFAYPLGHKTIQVIILNSRTHAFLGSYFGQNLPASKADGQALLRRVFVSGPGVRP